MIQTVRISAPRFSRLRWGILAGLGLAAAIVVALSPPGRAAGSESESLVWIKGGTLIDGTGREPLPEAWILIQGDTLLRVGAAGSFAKPRHARVIRARGFTILPGLIDAHVHLAFSGTLSSTYLRPQPRGIEVCLRNLRAELFGGVTLVRDLFAPLPVIQRVASRARTDTAPSAGLIFAGPALSPPGGYGSPAAMPIESPQEGRSAVQELARAGVGVIKVAITRRQLGGQVLPPMSAEVANSIVEEAHLHGLPVAAHVAGATVDDLRVAVQAGVDSLEHMPGIADPTQMPDTYYSSSGLLPEIVSRGIVIVPTLSVEVGESYAADLPELSDDPALILRLDSRQRETLAGNRADFYRNPARQANARAGRERIKLLLEEVRRLHAAGVRLGVGSDAGNSFAFHGNLFTEISYLNQAGLSPMEALQAATRGNAVMLGVSGSVGTVEEGKRADLLLIRGNPLEDLKALRNVEMVVIHGRVVDVRRQLKEALRDNRSASAAPPEARGAAKGEGPSP